MFPEADGGIRDNPIRHREICPGIIHILFRRFPKIHARKEFLINGLNFWGKV